MSPHPETPPSPYVVSYLTIRKGVGLLAILLPVVLVAGLALIFGEDHLEPSISDYYYTKMGGYFVGTLCAVTLFLYCYKGYALIDRVTCRLAGVFALGIAFFPASPAPLYNVLAIDYKNWVETVHFTSAALLFATLAFISLFLFTRTDDLASLQANPRKRRRNIVYVVCGIVMLAAVLGILAYFLFFERDTTLHPVFFLETIALWAFGVSWLTKGQFLLPDRGGISPGSPPGTPRA